MPTRVLLVDDDVKLGEVLRAYLAPHGYDIEQPPNELIALALLADHQGHAPPWAIVILDGMMPQIDGVELCARIRALPNPNAASLPIIMLSARSDQGERLRGLEAGADDYIGKPFFGPELLARMRAVLRRSGSAANTEAQAAEPADLQLGDLRLTPQTLTATLDDSVLDLTPFEFRVLYHLASHAGKPVTRKQLAQSLTPEVPYDPAVDRSLDVHISRIRQKIEKDSSRPERLKTVRGVGYLMTRT
jgi:DNA-binding response OmpR family regulator